MSNHPIVHIEFSAKDRESASAFYHDLFGWEIQQFPDMNYATFASGSVGGGFNPINDGNPAGTVIVYINTDNIDESLKKVEELGGKNVTPKAEIPGVGWFAIFRDPTGNQVALLQPIPGSM
jgi:uncharacterized protein